MITSLQRAYRFSDCELNGARLFGLAPCRHVLLLECLAECHAGHLHPAEQAGCGEVVHILGMASSGVLQPPSVLDVLPQAYNHSMPIVLCRS
jgi:hypothetical protein